MQTLRSLPNNTPIISTNPDVVLLWADRPAYDLNEQLSPAFLESTNLYGADATDPSQAVFQQGGILVVFNNYQAVVKSKYGSAGKERLKTMLDGLTVYGTFDKGTLYTYPK